MIPHHPTTARTLIIKSDERYGGMFSPLDEVYDTAYAADLTHGLRLVKEYAPALVIVDSILLSEDFRSQLTRIFPAERIPVLAIFQRTELIAQPLLFGSTWDDFLQSPFEAHELLLRVSRMLSNTTHEQSTEDHPKSSQRISNGFLHKINQLVEENLDNALFGVTELAREAAVSQAQLYRKVVILTGYSPNAYIRHIRLRHAVSLLAQGGWNVGEVAHRVGFSSPSYFTKCFKAAHRCNPKEALG